MPNLTTPFLFLGGTDINKDMDEVQNWSINLIEELKYILCNLDAGNVTEAHSVKAQNIDCTQARIHNAQIQSLTADKLTAGTIDAGEITVKGEDENGMMIMSGETLVFYEKDEHGENKPRICIGFNGQRYVFEVYNREGQKEIEMDDNGNVIFRGIIRGGKIDSDTDINVTKDARIGRKIILQDRNENTAGYEEAGIIAVGDGVMQISAKNNRSINVDTGGNINLSCGSCMVNGKEVATQADIDELKEEIKDLQNKINCQ